MDKRKSTIIRWENVVVTYSHATSSGSIVITIDRPVFENEKKGRPKASVTLYSGERFVRYQLHQFVELMPFFSGDGLNAAIKETERKVEEIMEKTSKRATDRDIKEHWKKFNESANANTSSNVGTGLNRCSKIDALKQKFNQAK
jgi:hypothetical protein